MQNNNNDMLCWTHKRAFFFDALKDLKKLPSDDRYGGIALTSKSLNSRKDQE